MTGSEEPSVQARHKALRPLRLFAQGAAALCAAINISIGFSAVVGCVLNEFVFVADRTFSEDVLDFIYLYARSSVPLFAVGLTLALLGGTKWTHAILPAVAGVLPWALIVMVYFIEGFRWKHHNSLPAISCTARLPPIPGEQVDGR